MGAIVCYRTAHALLLAFKCENDPIVPMFFFHSQIMLYEFCISFFLYIFFVVLCIRFFKKKQPHNRQKPKKAIGKWTRPINDDRVADVPFASVFRSSAIFSDWFNTYVDQLVVITLAQVMQHRSVVKIRQIGHILCLLVFGRIDLLEQIFLQIARLNVVWNRNGNKWLISWENSHRSDADSSVA